MKNLPSTIHVGLIYPGFIYTTGTEAARKGAEWKAMAKVAVSNGGRVERDTDQAVAIYAANGERVAEVYPS